MSIGAKLNNPFDLKVAPTFRWQGEMIETTGMINDLCEFDTLENGLRAGFKDLFNAWKLDGLNTLRALVYHYAPPTENDSEAYLTGCVATTGWGASAPLDLSTPSLLARCGKAFLIEEQGQDYVASLDSAMFDRAVSAALAD